MLNKIKLDVDVQVLFVDVSVDEFRLVVTQHSRHCSRLEYPKDVPKKIFIHQQTNIRHFQISLTAFFGGAFICGGSGGTETEY